MAEDDPLARLIEAACEGDNVALERFVAASERLVWKVCAALGSPGEQEDLVQEVYLRAIAGLDRYRADAPAHAWLVGIARRVCADHVRERNRQRRLLDRVSLQRSRHQTDPPATPVDDQLDVLGSKRDAFVLTRLYGLSYEEAALVLDCPVGTIRSRVARARLQLAALDADSGTDRSLIGARPRRSHRVSRSDTA